MAATPSKHSQKRHVGSKSMETEEIVRHMSNLPSYLERGKPIQDKALNFGVMDWGCLEQWQYHRHKHSLVMNNKYSPSSSNSSLLFSTDESSPHSSVGKSSSSAPLKPHHVTLQSHLNVSPEEISTRFGKSCSPNLEKSQDFKDSPLNQCSQKKATNCSRIKPKSCKLNDLYPRNLPGSKSLDDLGSFQTVKSSKGKIKIQDELVNELGNFQDPSYGTSHTNGEKSKDIHSDPNNDVPSTFSFESEVVNRKNVRNEANSERNHSSQCQIKTPEKKECSVSSKNSDSSKHRNHSSPLRRLLDPLFPSKTSHEDSKIKGKVKLDLRSCKEVRVDDSCRNKMNESSSSSTKQALFQMAVKNGRPLFTFAVDNNIDILAATVKSLSGKGDTNSWIYTFFTVHEVKKKKGGWLSQGTKGTGQGYLPNITAQMKVSNPSNSNSTTREFVLFSVDPSLDDEILDAHLQDELAAIVVRFLRTVDEEDDQDCFGMTVILPGGHHGVPSKGEPSPLIARWQSGGACDCGGWDVGCRLRTLANNVQSNRRSNSPEDHHMTSGTFDLFFHEDAPNERPFFSLSPLKEGIFSVEYNTSLSVLHAFSICISVIECRKSSHHTEHQTYVAKQVDDNEGPVTYASLPPVSPVGRV